MQHNNPNTMRYSTLVWIVAAVGLLSGCKSLMNRRIAAHQEAWQALSEQDQHRLSQGHVLLGDTEEMVLIALGPPDEVLPITTQDGQKQTVWQYEELISSGDNFLISPTSSTHTEIREKSVIFHDGRVVQQAPIAVNDGAKLAGWRSERTAENWAARLDHLVTLTAEQKVKAREVFAKAQEALLVFRPEERLEKGRPIRVKMRAEIRALLTPEQQIKYDATPQYRGGGSTRRP